MKVQARFVISAAKPTDFPPEGLPEIAVVGRSNVGKSSLINTLIGQPIARTSRTPGRTRLINWFEIDNKFHLVDLPGYGYAAVNRDMRESWRPLIESYLGNRKTLAGVLMLLDVRRGAEEEELDFVPWLEAKEVPIVVALTKADKLPKNKRMLEVTKAKKALGLRRDPFAVSAQTGDGIDPLWRALLALLFVIEPATAADLDAIDEIERRSFPAPWPRATFEAERCRASGRASTSCAKPISAWSRSAITGSSRRSSTCSRSRRTPIAWRPRDRRDAASPRARHRHRHRVRARDARGPAEGPEPRQQFYRAGTNEPASRPFTCAPATARTTTRTRS